jgi:hypothetical protein
LAGDLVVLCRKRHHCAAFDHGNPVQGKGLSMKKFVTDWAAKSGPGGHLSAFTGEEFSDAG